MTEQQFLQQVWRPYDSITTDTGIKGRVQNVCFPTRSVRIQDTRKGSLSSIVTTISPKTIHWKISRTR